MDGQAKIESMYAYIMLDDDGTEGVPAFMDSSGMVLPMVGADLARVTQLRELAERSATLRGKTITLAHFTNRVDLEVFIPGES